MSNSKIHTNSVLSLISLSGAEPSPAYFNILTYNENVTVLDGTQLAADWTFSGLQKFGQGLLDRLKGLQLPRSLLEKVKSYFTNIFFKQNFSKIYYFKLIFIIVVKL